MNIGRVGFDSVVLGDGSVLVVGDDHACIPGGADPGSDRAAVYEPAGDRWIEVESLNKPRKMPATVGLRDGSAMVIGGINAEDVPFSSTKIFSQTTRTWTDGPLLDVARGQPMAATLVDGRVLVASLVAVDETSGTTTTEIYDPSVGTWSRAATLEGPYLNGLLPLADGRVLGFGSAFEVTVWLEVYDPARNSWKAIEPPPAGHVDPEFIALEDGAILAVGGYSEFEEGRFPTAMVERYEPADDRWVDVESLPTTRTASASVRLADGRVLVAGGNLIRTDGVGRALRTVDAYDPRTGRWSALPDLLEPRYGGRAVVLADGSVLVMGGYATFNTEGDTPWCPAPMTSVERFSPPPP